MEDGEPRSWDYDAPTDWQGKIMDHIITINHELGDLVRDMHWMKKVIRMILIVVILLVIAQGEELVGLLKKALGLLV